MQGPPPGALRPERSAPLPPDPRAPRTRGGTPWPLPQDRWTGSVCPRDGAPRTPPPIVRRHPRRAPRREPGLPAHRSWPGGARRRPGVSAKSTPARSSAYVAASSATGSSPATSMTRSRDPPALSSDTRALVSIKRPNGSPGGDRPPRRDRGRRQNPDRARRRHATPPPPRAERRGDVQPAARSAPPDYRSFRSGTCLPCSGSARGHRRASWPARGRQSVFHIL